MGKTPSKLNSILLLDSPSTAKTATVTGGTDKSHVFLRGWRHGFLLIDIKTVDVSSLDEAYTFQLKGRMTATGSYTTLASKAFAAGAAAVGGYLVDVDQFMPFMVLDVVIAGTTPSILYTAYAIAAKHGFTYGPGGVVLST